MLIDKNKCVGCGQCVPYCPVTAITLKARVEKGGKRRISEIDFDDCVECGNCLHWADCPMDAIYQQELVWPRILRSSFSSVLTSHKETGIPGRGTAEMKTNDVTGRFKRGYAGIAVEFGRPVLGARLYDVEKMAKVLAPMGVKWEKANPATSLIKNHTTGEFKEDVLNEKVLSIILEFVVEEKKLPEILEVVKKVSKEIDTVFALDLITRLTPDGSVPTAPIITKLGLVASPNGKTNIPLGRPLAKED
jgi:NAD-dependent dihydropyrimidine dehydrogenase PreA subunit